MTTRTPDSGTRVRRRRGAYCAVHTELGDFELEFATRKAPITSAYFIGLVQAGGLDGTSIYRIATSRNQGDRVSWPIEVIQGGRSPCDIEVRSTIVHEPTIRTGLRHRRWAVSTSRYEAGEPYGSFFVCMRDEPELDFGGRRHPDGLGFAAFGRVSAGFSALESMVRRAEGSEYLTDRIRIIRARMIRGDS